MFVTTTTPKVELVVLLEPVDGEGAYGNVGVQDDCLESLLPESLESLDVEPAGYGRLRSLKVVMLGVIASHRLARLKLVTVRYDPSYILTWVPVRTASGGPMDG